MDPIDQLPVELEQELRAAAAIEPKRISLEARFADGRGNQPVTVYLPNEIQLVRLWLYLPEYCENWSDPFPSSDVYYGVDVVDLLETVPSYDPTGVLCWIPALNRFGTYDSSHCVMHSFPGATWTMIRESSARYVNAQWFPDRVDCELVRPWDDESFSDVPQSDDPWRDLNG